MDYGGDGGNRRVQISFDDMNKIRILEAEDFKQTEQLATDSARFVQNVELFTDNIQNLVKILEVQSKQIEREKMRAIGERNKIDAETENRRRQEAEMKYRAAQKQAELQRTLEYVESLKK
jgi:intraflagellar transport protein 20